MSTKTSWTAFHRRGDVIRAVSHEADLRRDGVLPMQVAGVEQTFSDDLDLVSALQLRWHTRLAGMVERSLAEQPLDLEAAVEHAWAETAHELPGIRAILDRCSESPSSTRMAQALTTVAAKERVFLAMAAGRASGPGVEAESVGREIQLAASAAQQVAEPVAEEPVAEPVPAGSAAFVARIKAVLAA
ncbi:MAG: hypothetical protein ACR2FG_00205 [Marmoricola sp.]